MTRRRACLNGKGVGISGLSCRTVHIFYFLFHSFQSHFGSTVRPLKVTHTFPMSRLARETFRPHRKRVSRGTPANRLRGPKKRAIMSSHQGRGRGWREGTACQKYLASCRKPPKRPETRVDVGSEIRSLVRSVGSRGASGSVKEAATACPDYVSTSIRGGSARMFG